ncbi:MAG TPA: kynureninase [Acidobacteriota bacterium]|nr:kynureninase [Acidobacteriota bacterium]HQM65014.1 kynureninase [Acidobacteriota bacterium]
MGHTPEALARHPNPLAAHYRRFRVGERLLLTGHSHQAWPDCGFEGQLRAWLDAAEWVDDKWARAFEQADAVRRGFARLLDDPGGDIALGASTHELLLRFLSALPLARRPRLVTTDGEFHTIRRQLDRLAEEGIEVVRVPAEPADDAAERLAAAADDRTAAALVSSVFFGSGRIVPGLGVLAERCRRVGAALLVDAYHSLNVVPFSVRAEGLADAFIVGGGYKYCQLGEGNCFLRLPPGCRLRPVVTGWFAEFAALDQAPEAGVGYGEGATRFAGSTYDPTSHYRAAAVFDFFAREGLEPALLRAVSRRQVGLLAARFDALALDPAVITRDRTVPLEALGGFLVLRAPAAADICRRLKAAGVWADSRGEALRLGPAPYLSDSQLEAAVAILGEVIHSA